ncbi:MAG: iron ABC transporter permease, partial [Negativicutes bacterium]|nr:iron ABC transporter permease [Negativicutes bacterium]
LNALLSAAMALYAHQAEAIIFWLMGSVSSYGGHLGWIVAAVAAVMAVITVFGRDLDVLSLGEDNARYLGLDVARLKWLLLVLVTAMTAVIVSVTGIIGFVGLIVPHCLRRLVGSGHSRLLPLVAVWGGIFLLLADDICRLTGLVSTVPIGVITALVGAPFFLFLLHRERRRWQL